MKTCEEFTQTRGTNFVQSRAFITPHNVHLTKGKATFLKETPKCKDKGWANDYKQVRKRSVREAMCLFKPAEHGNINSGKI